MLRIAKLMRCRCSTTIESAYNQELLSRSTVSDAGFIRA